MTNSLNVIHEVLAGERQAACIGTPTSSRPQCVLPGSFNPLHAAHTDMQTFAARRIGTSVAFELSITNVDKATLTEPDVVDRLRQFPDDVVWLTRAPTFAEKANLFPGCCFVVGTDTALRLLDVRYYRDVASMDAAMSAIQRHGCRFMVFGRRVQQTFISATTLSVPGKLSHLFDLIPETQFRHDISSSEIRRNSRSDGA